MAPRSLYAEWDAFAKKYGRSELSEIADPFRGGARSENSITRCAFLTGFLAERRFGIDLRRRYKVDRIKRHGADRSDSTVIAAK